MKQLIAVLLLVLCTLAASAKAAKSDDVPLSHEDSLLLDKAVKLVDKGQAVTALMDFETLATKYPKNFLVQYERIYCLYHLGRFDDVIKCRKTVLDNKDTRDIAYQMVGNAYDCVGQTDKAVKTYEEGLKRFPDSGLLYLELGNICFVKQEFDKALDNYNLGIVGMPNFASNYYRAANLYLASTNLLVWGLVYGEAAILLAPDKTERHEELARKMVACYKDNIHFDFDDEKGLKVTFVPSRNVTVDNESKKTYLAFPGIYEGAISQPLKQMYDEKIPFTGSVRQLMEIRKGMVETYYSVTDNLYGNSMYLLEYQKQVIDAGHWEAYNYFIFGMYYPDEYSHWCDTHVREIKAFAKWYGNTPFRLGDGRSVDVSQIYNCYRPLSMLEALMIQSQLLTDKKDAQ